MIGRYTYNAKGSGECSMDKGENVEVLIKDAETGWTHVRNHSSGQEGLVPTAYLTIK